MTGTPVPAPTHGLSRRNFAFSPSGGRATCIRSSEGRYDLEVFSLGSPGRSGAGHAASRTVEVPVDLGPGTRTLPLDDGRVLVLPNSAEVSELVQLEPREGGWAVRRLGRLRALGGYLLPSPTHDQVGFLVSRDDVEHSTVWRVTAAPPRVEPLVALPGAASGGVWLDGEASALALDLARYPSPPEGVGVDLVQRTWTRWLSVSEASADRVVLYSPRSGLLVVSTNAFGEPRLGLVTLGSGEAVRFPEGLHAPGYPRDALALDESGERLLLHWQQGAVSRLGVYTPQDDSLAPVGLPAGTAEPEAARWSGGAVRLPFSTPDRPTTVLTVRTGGEPAWSPAGDDVDRSELPDRAEHPERVGSTVRGSGWAGADLVELPGPEGPIEAVVYGGPGWLSSERLVLALHGGPLAGWRYEFEPLFQALAAGGVAVVAPNYRGSTGYGDAHRRAVLGAWGGPDLDDVLHLGNHLSRLREARRAPGPVVFGASYGAFLALLAAGCAPGLWSACVAVAPFLSGPRLHAGSPPWVARRLEHLGALEPVTDALGPRDVLRACPAISVPLLVLHGIDDEVVPVEQARQLRRRLLRLGRAEGVDFWYRELAGSHEDVTRADRSPLRDAVVDFCRSGGSDRHGPRPRAVTGGGDPPRRRGPASAVRTPALSLEGRCHPCGSMTSSWT